MKCKEPTAPSEFEVQALLWSELRRIGLNVRGEVKLPIPDRNRRAYCRFDLAEFIDGDLVGIIEVKAHPVSHGTPGGWWDTRQGTRYSAVGVPVRVIYGMRDAEQLIGDVEIRGYLFGSPIGAQLAA